MVDRLLLGHRRSFYSEGRRTISKQSPNNCLGHCEPASCKEGCQATALNFKSYNRQVPGFWHAQRSSESVT